MRVYKSGSSSSSGSSALTTRTINASSTLTSADDVIIIGNTSANITVTMPTASTCSGKIIRILRKDQTSHIASIAYSGQGIDGFSSIKLANRYAAVELYCDGTAWLQVGKKKRSYIDIFDDYFSTYDDDIISADCTDPTNVTYLIVYLPDAAFCIGKPITIIKSDTTSNFVLVSVAIDSDQTIEGVDPLLLVGKNDSVTLVGNGSGDGWLVLGRDQSRITNVTNTDYTILTSDKYIYCNAGGSAVTVTLPPATAMQGRNLIITKVDSGFNSVTIDGYSSETINGSPTQTLNVPYQTKTLYSNGAGWVSY